MIEYSAGIVTAYGSAVRAGYTGTYEDFCRQQAGYAENAQAVEQAKQTAVSASQSANQAKQDAQTASTTAQSASQSAQGSAQSAGQSAQDAQTAKNNAQTYAQSASQSAGSAQQSAQSAQSVLESIPEDYSDLSANVSQLKADLGDADSNIKEGADWIGYQLNYFDANLFTTTNTTNFTITKTKTSINVVHNNSYSTGMPVADLNLPTGEYIFTADFSNSSVKTMQILVYGSSTASETLNSGDTFVIEAGHTYKLMFYVANAGTYTVTNISVCKLVNGIYQELKAVDEATEKDISDIYTSIDGITINAVGLTDIYLKQGESIYIDVFTNSVQTNVYTSPYYTGDTVLNIPAPCNDTLIFTASKDGYIKFQETATNLHCFVYRRTRFDKSIYTIKKDGTGDFSSFVGALQAMSGDSREKTIYIYDGVYDIYAELGGDAFIATIANPSSLNWRDVNPVVPPNTRIIGIGNVKLSFAPTAEQIGSDEMAFLFSPLNLSGNCHIENISIYGTNCRYAIHDESSSLSYYNDAVQSFVNVRAKKEKGTYGNNDCFGAGIGARAKWTFDSCEFESDRDYVFSVHTSKSEAQDLATVIMNNCIVMPQNNATIGIRLLSGTSGHNATENIFKINNSYVDGSIYLTTGVQDSIQRFNVLSVNTYSKSGVIIDSKFVSNPFTPRIYSI